MVAFVHDELIIEVPQGSDYRQARDNLRRVMINSMKEVIPDVEIDVKCNGVMKHWHKEVELTTKKRARSSPPINLGPG